MKKKVTLGLLFLLFLYINIYAETYNRGLGFTAGKVSGIGFAYRQYFEKNGMQLTFGFLSDADNVPKFPETYYSDSLSKTGWEVDGWMSAMYLRVLRESELTKFYYFVGGSINIDYKKQYTQMYLANQQDGSPEKKIKNDNAYYFGPGIGLDFQISKYVSFIIELPVSISSDMKIDTYVPQGGVIVRF